MGWVFDKVINKHKHGCGKHITKNISHPPSLWAEPGYPYDLKQAMALHTVGANANEPASLRFFAQIYHDGLGVKRCLTTSFKWQKQAADLGDPKAQYNLAVMYHKGKGTPADEEASRQSMEQSAYGGDIDGQCQHGLNLIDQGQIRKGLVWLAQSSDNGCDRATEILTGVMDPNNRSLLEQSARAGNLNSQLRLHQLQGQPYSYQDIPMDSVLETFRNLELVDLTCMTDQGKYTLLDTLLLRAKPKYRRRAWGMLEWLANSDCPHAKRRMAYYYERGDQALRLKKDPAKALQLWEEASREDPSAMLKLVDHDPNRSPEQVRELINRAAACQYPPAAYQQGLRHEQKKAWQPALQSHRDAVRYEQEEYHEAWVMGPLDVYEPITALAEPRIAVIKALVSKEQERSDKKTAASRQDEPVDHGDPPQEQAEQVCSSSGNFYSFWKWPTTRMVATAVAVATVGASIYAQRRG